MQFNKSPETTDEELYNELFTPLFRYFVFRIKDYDLAGDLTQSTFLKFLVQENRPVTKDHSLRLLFTIARTLLIDHYRVASKRVHESIEGTDFDIQSDMPNPEEAFEMNEDLLLIRKFINELEEVETEVVTLRITGDVPYEDIAKIIGITSSNARQIYSRALVKLRKSFEKNNIINKN